MDYKKALVDDLAATVATLTDIDDVKRIMRVATLRRDYLNTNKKSQLYKKSPSPRTLAQIKAARAAQTLNAGDRVKFGANVTPYYMRGLYGTVMHMADTITFRPRAGKEHVWVKVDNVQKAKRRAGQPVRVKREHLIKLKT